MYWVWFDLWVSDVLSCFLKVTRRSTFSIQCSWRWRGLFPSDRAFFLILSCKFYLLHEISIVRSICLYVDHVLKWLWSAFVQVSGWVHDDLSTQWFSIEFEGFLYFTPPEMKLNCDWKSVLSWDSCQVTNSFLYRRHQGFILASILVMLLCRANHLVLKFRFFPPVVIGTS